MHNQRMQLNTVSPTIYLVWWNQCGELKKNVPSCPLQVHSMAKTLRSYLPAFLWGHSTLQQYVTALWHTPTCGPMSVIKSEKERIADSALWASRRKVVPFCFVFPLPLFTKYSTVIDCQGQRNRQLRMTDCMHSFNTCHSKDTSLQFKKRNNLKRKSWSHTPSHPGARY